MAVAVAVAVVVVVVVVVVMCVPSVSVFASSPVFLSFCLYLSLCLPTFCLYLCLFVTVCLRVCASVGSLRRLPALCYRPMASIGKQTLSHQRNASGVVAPRGTRDEAQRVHPAMMPQPAGTAEVGPGRYRAAPSVGPQLLSTKRSAGATVIGSGLRPPLSSAATASPGPAYNPKYTFRTQAMNTPDVRFPQAERTSTVGPERSPGPVYDIMACSTGKAKPSFSIGKAKRPANVTRSYTNEMYDVSSVRGIFVPLWGWGVCVWCRMLVHVPAPILSQTFAGHQRVAPKIGFGKAKRF